MIILYYATYNYQDLYAFKNIKDAAIMSQVAVFHILYRCAQVRPNITCVY